MQPKHENLFTRYTITYRNTTLCSYYTVNTNNYTIFQDDEYVEIDVTTPSPMLSALPDSPSPTGFNESTMSQSMWTEEIEYVDLEKGDRGLGFSILDYKVSFLYRTNK